MSKGKINFETGREVLVRSAMAAGMLVFLPIASVQAAEIPNGTITVTNVKDDKATVTAYQLVDGVYSEENKLTRYVLTDSEHMSLADMKNPTAEEIAGIANYIEGNPGSVTGQQMTLSDKETGTWTLQAEPGEYLILVTGTGDTVYNPAVVSVNVTDADQMSLEDGSVDYTSWFGSGSSAYLKSSATGLKKSVMKGGQKLSGCSAAVGEELTFVIDAMQIPSYSDSYDQVIYQITDQLEKGAFDGIQNLQVSVNGNAVEAGDDTWTVNYGSDRCSFEVSFADSYLRAHGMQTVEIRYTSKLTDAAGLNYAENTNVAVLRYSNNPADAASVQEKTAATYQYTFGLGANIDGEGTKEQQVETEELNKVTKAAGKGAYEKVSDTYSGTGATLTNRSKYALAGAEFSLYKDAAMTQQLKVSKSDQNGRISFTGLAEGEYYMKETAAPAGYASNDRKYHVTIAAQYREDGILNSYTVTTKEMQADGTETEAGAVTYTSDAVVEEDGSVTNTIESSGTPAEIVNVPLVQLPSAGGAGTFGFVLAAAGMSGGFLLWKLSGRKRSR